MKMEKSKLNDDSGSISILIIGLFVAALAALMVITDVAVVANAKRVLDQASEAAAMRAVRNLDEASYYRGKHTVLTSVWELAQGGGYSDNRVPIDCDKGQSEALAELNSWIQTSSKQKTVRIESFKLEGYQCVYDSVSLQTSALIKLPFPAPFSDFDSVQVHSDISTRNVKDKGLYLFGLRIH